MQEITFARHLHRRGRDYYYQMRKLHSVVRSLAVSPATTLVHAFITTRLLALCHGLGCCLFPRLCTDTFNGHLKVHVFSEL